MLKSLSVTSLMDLEHLTKFKTLNSLITKNGRNSFQWTRLKSLELVEAIAPEEKMDAALYGSRIAAIFNQVQLEFSGADFSCTSLGNDPLGLDKKITIRDICRIYTFSNTVLVRLF